jgi:phospholipid transport system substrate-binding protein
LSRRAVPRLTQMRDQGAPISVQWHVHQGDGGGFRIGDIVVEGVSMAVTYRSDYAAATQANGGRIDSLLSSMRTKIDQLKANN